jgi:fructokinase
MRIPHDRERDPFPGSCPFHGDCFEGLASGTAIRERWGAPGAELAGRDEVWELEAGYVALGLVSVIAVLSPERIVLGGGVTGAGDGFLRPVLRELDAIRAASELAAEMLPPEIVAISSDGREAGSWGAVSVARERAAREEVVAREAMA